MSIEELKAALNFVVDDGIEKYMSIYVTTNGRDLLLFNIINADLNELKEAFIDSIKSRILDAEELILEDYSTSTNRNHTIYRYDLSENEKPPQMINMRIENMNPAPFNPPQGDDFSLITGIYVKINGGPDHFLVLYKMVYPVDKLYTKKNFFFFGNVNGQMEREKKTFLRLSPNFDMLSVADEIILMNLDKLEKKMGLDSILRNECRNDINRIDEKQLIEGMGFLENVCEKSATQCRSLRIAVTKGHVFQQHISNPNIIAFARNNANYFQLHFNEDGTKIVLKSKAEAKRFIKLLNDSFLHSNLTGINYDSEVKNAVS